MALDMTTAAAVLKTLYPPERIKQIVYENQPFLAMVPKDENFTGKNMEVPLNYGSPQGRSATFANAQANADNSKYKAFTITRVKDYGVGVIDNETIKAARDNKGAFIRALESEMDNMLFSVKRSLGISLYRNGSGSIGRISASSGVTTVITLSEPRDAANFEEGMVLVLSTADGGGSVKTGTTKVTAVDEDAGTVTVATSMATFTPVGAVNDYVFMQGDYDAKISGLDAWVPTSAPGATAFFGVDRSVSPRRLGGARIAGTGAPIEETLIDAMERMASYGAMPSHFYMNFKEWGQLAKSLEGKKGFQDISITIRGDNGPIVGFSGIRMTGPSGAVDIIPDVNCPAGRGYLLQLNTWKLHSLGPAPHIFDTDGLSALRQASADGIEVRGQYYAQLACNAPGFNAVVTF